MAQYIKDEFTGENIAIQHDEKGITIDPANTDYAELMRQVADGEIVIQEADL
jgi:hypothetical protein